MTKYKNFKNFKNFKISILILSIVGAQKDVRVNSAGIWGVDRWVCFNVSQIRRQWERMT